MKKIGVLFIGLMLLISFMSLTLADSENSNRDKSDDSDSDSGSDDSDDDSSSSGSSKDSDRDRTEFKREIKTDSFEEKIERKNGETKIERKFIDADGNERKVKIEIKEEDGERRVKIEREGLEFKSKLEFREDISGNVTKLKAKVRNGTEEIEIKVLPDRASLIARERLRLNFGNDSLEIREITRDNVPRVVYHLEGNKSGRFLGVFKLALKAETQIDAETGEVIFINKPWWAFLVNEEDEQEIPETPGNETVIDSNETIIDMNETIDSNVSDGTFLEGSNITANESELPFS